MHKYLAILAAVTLAACSGGEGTEKTAGDDDDTVGDDDDDSCAVSVVDQFPADGEAAAYYKTDVRFTLSDPDPAATIEVKDAGGAVVSGTTTTMDNLVIWEGDDLSPTTDYTATLTYSCGSATAAWATSETGGSTGGAVVDEVFDLNLSSGSWILPSPEVGALLATQLDVELLVMPVSADSEIVIRGALGTGADAQDECSPSIEFPAASFSDPFFQIAADVLTLDVAGYSIDINELDLSGAFAPDASLIQGASLQGTIDTRPLVDFLVPGGPPEAVCDLVGTFGVACEACAGGGGDYCISVWVDNIAAVNIDGAPLVEITEADIAANGACL